MGSERRRHERRQPRSHASAALGESLPTVGKITDISQSGLSFEYIATGEAIDEVLPKIDIFLLDDDFYLSDIRCNVVYDVPVERHDEYFKFGTHLETRRCGVQFELVADDQASQLRQFLDSHAACAAS